MTTSIRNAAAGDLEAINAIYNHYVHTSAATFDTVSLDMARRSAWFEQFSATGPHRLLVAVLDMDVAGFVCSTQLKPRAAYDISIETTVYVRYDAVGKGLGHQLYAALFDALADENLHRAYAGITLPNPASEALHEAFGFHVAGVFDQVGFKFDRYWSVRWYEKPL